MFILNNLGLSLKLNYFLSVIKLYLRNGPKFDESLGFVN